MPHLKTDSQTTFWRSLHALNIVRLLIACLLFLFWGLVNSGVPATASPFTYLNISVFYLGIAVVFALYTVFDRRNFFPQLVTQISADIAVVCLFYLVAGGMKGGMAILFLFPITSAAILMQMPMALFFASIVTIFMLGGAFSRFVHGHADTSFTHAGLYGAAFFATVFFLNRLAAKLIDQERLALLQEQALHTQEEINRLVIAEMDDGVMVVDNDGVIFTCNPAAQNLLGVSWNARMPRPRLLDVAYLKPLADAFFTWRNARGNTSLSQLEPVAYLNIKPAKEEATTTLLHRDDGPALGNHLKIRFSTVTTEPLHQDLNVIFLQDVAKIDERAQQLKLAAMGRLTASIAHEVRNPLAAISHASALFAEDAQSPSQQRLLKIVSDNVSRLNRMVEDILNLSRKAQSQELIDLSEIIDDIKTSFEEIHGLPQDRLYVDIPENLRVRFDPVHLREVVLNLLNNALRYSSGLPGSIRLYTIQSTPTRMELHVQDDGPPITPAVRAHLFEPFYTTSRQGTGLGLYLARELCSNNGAMLDYEFHLDLRNLDQPTGRFVITFAAPDIHYGGFPS
ncbi:MAG: PAS domain-containing protein [Oxalobacter sp.]|nr:MAG: PAS domain-containing protein [Oxalobacter sp.]